MANALIIGRSGSYVGQDEIGEGVSGGTTYTKTLSEAVALSDALLLSRYRQRGPFTDTLSLYDSNVQLIRELRRGDSIDSLLDSQHLSRQRGRVMDDLISVTDDFIKVITGGGPTVFTVVLSDGTVLTDGLLVERQRNRHFVDLLDLGDQQYLSRERGRLMPDAVSVLADAMFLSRERGRVVPDGIAITDEQSLFRLRNRIFSDNVTVTDGLLAYRLFFRLLDDFVSLTDGFIKSITSGQNIFTITLSDAVQVADGILATRYRNRHFVEPLSLADELLVTRYRNRGPFTDAVTLTDGTVVTRERLRHLSETLSITDAQLHFLLRTVQASDQISVSDGLLAFRLRSRDLIDALSVFDGFSATILGPIAPITVEVRVRLGMQDRTELGQHAPIRLGSSDDIVLGGYN